MKDLRSFKNFVSLPTIIIIPCSDSPQSYEGLVYY
jgi:hypothetical protein